MPGRRAKFAKDQALTAIPNYHRDLTGQIVRLCLNKDMRCVIDFSANDTCTSDPQGLHLNPAPPEAVLDHFVSMCRDYRWRKSHGVYVIEPADSTRSAVNIIVGPIHETLTAQALIETLGNLGGLKGGDGISSISGWGLPKFKKFKFDLPRDTFKRNLIRAASRIGPSYWLVERDHFSKGASRFILQGEEDMQRRGFVNY